MKHPDRGWRTLALVIPAGILLALIALWGSVVSSEVHPPPSQETEGARPEPFPSPQTTLEARTAASEDPQQAPSLDVETLDLRELLRRVAAAEERIANSPPGVAGEVAQHLQASLEAAIEAILAEEAALYDILSWLRPHSDGSRRLSDQEEYGAIRALYWWIVVSAGSGAERPALMHILEALPTLHPGCLGYLVDNLVLAAADGRKVLDASYLDALLGLRSRYPEHGALFAELLTGLADSLTDQERSAFLALFTSADSDPALVAVTLENLLSGSQAQFALFLAGQRFDDPAGAAEIRAAIADTIARHADVFSATTFLVERSGALGEAPMTWLELGSREDAQVALEAAYFDLSQHSADPATRISLVMAMVAADADLLSSIAQSDPDPSVIRQALLTLTANRYVATDPALGPRVFGLIDEAIALRPNEFRPDDFVFVVSNIGKSAKRSGSRDSLDRAVAYLRDVAQNRALEPSRRRAALDALKPLCSAEEWAALEADF